MTKLTNAELDILQDFCDEYEYDLREDYSGRCMYGKTCIGFVADCNGFEIAMNLTRFLRDVNEENLLEKFINQGSRSDQMGLSGIIYFPGLSAENEVA